MFEEKIGLTVSITVCTHWKQAVILVTWSVTAQSRSNVQALSSCPLGTSSELSCVCFWVCHTGMCGVCFTEKDGPGKRQAGTNLHSDWVQPIIQNHEGAETPGTVKLRVNEADTHTAAAATALLFHYETIQMIHVLCSYSKFNTLILSCFFFTIMKPYQEAKTSPMSSSPNWICSNSRHQSLKQLLKKFFMWYESEYLKPRDRIRGIDS